MTYSNAKVLDTKNQPAATITLESVWLDQEKRPGYIVKASMFGHGDEVLLSTKDRAEAVRTFNQY